MGNNLINRDNFMVQNPTESDLKREAIYKAKQVAHGIEKAGRKTSRKVSDKFTTPSTMAEVERFFEDVWKDDIKPAMDKLNVNVKREMSQLGNDISELIHGNETTASIAKGFSDLAKKISQNPVMKALGNFCSKMGDLVMSLAGTSKDREKA
jgi:hypothetical protein